MKSRETEHEKKRILVSPLDWGIGHATRCIPIIQELLDQGAQPILASSGRAYDLLLNEFPDLPLFELPDYNIRYLFRNMVWNVAAQSPRVLTCIWREYKMIQKIVRTHKVSGIISDNRFGCFSPLVRSVFITHQLNIKAPGVLFEKLGNLIHRSVVRRFDACWVPDFETFPGLAGNLSHPSLFSNTRYLGSLSRLEPVEGGAQYDMLILLSGPEPQRSKLEAILLEQTRTIEGRILLVQGKPEAAHQRDQYDHIEVIGFLNRHELSKVMSGSELVICRSGYSTVMDLAKLGKRAFFIPTPGQTEQEYLATMFEEQRICYSQNQDEVNLKEALVQAKSYSGFRPFSEGVGTNRLLRETVRSFLEKTGSISDQSAAFP